MLEAYQLGLCFTMEIELLICCQDETQVHSTGQKGFTITRSRGVIVILGDRGIHNLRNWGAFWRTP